MEVLTGRPRYRSERVTRGSSPDWVIPSSFEVVGSVEIDQQLCLPRVPSHLSACLLTGGLDVHRSKVREPPKVFSRLVRILADDRHVQSAPDHTGDVPKLYPFFRNCMIPGPSHTLLEDEFVEVSGVEPMHKRTKFSPFIRIDGSALFARDANNDRDKTVIAVTMH